MLPNSPVSWPLAVCALLALPAMAQVTPVPVAPLSTTAASAITTQPSPTLLPYASAWVAYQPFADENVRPWKESNTTVEKIGGWRAYAKEAAQLEAKHDDTPAVSSATPAKTPAAPADPHAGHGKH